MAEKNRNDLKSYFNAGDRPTENEFADLIDSFVNRLDDDFVESLPSANTSTPGIVRRSTAVEVTNGANVNAYVTPSNTVSAIEDRSPGLAPVQSVNNMTGDVVLDLGEDTGWIEPDLLNNIINYGTEYQVARFRKKNGVVYVEGLVKGGTNANQRHIFILPVGYRPTKRLVFTVYGGAGASVSAKRLDVQTNGVLTFYDYDSNFASLSGISFLVD